jgi:L-Ala-D/L-Glu epimerase
MHTTVERCELSLRTPLRTARGTLRQRTVFIVRVARDGLTGIGEASPLSAAGTEGTAATAAALDVAAGLLASGNVPLDPPGAWESHLLGALGGAPAARHGVDLALWDLAARRLDRPLSALLSDRAASAVRVNALLLGDDPARSAQAAAAAGFDVLKLKVAARPLAEDAARLAAVRAAAPDCRIRLDANGGWPNGRAGLAALAQLGLDNVESVEQPVPPHDRFGLSWVRGRIKPCVAADESVFNERAGLDLVDEGAADAVVLKPMKLGGLGSCMRVGRHALNAGLRVWVTTTIDGAVARLGALHLAAALDPEAREAHGVATAFMLETDIAQVPGPDGGVLQVPVGPGIGIDPGSVTLPGPNLP